MKNEQDGSSGELSRGGPRHSDSRGGSRGNSSRGGAPRGVDVPEALKDLVGTIAEALVDDPDSVEVQEIGGDNNSLIELRVAQEDIGKVIGKDGRTAQSIRTVLSAASMKLGRRAQLDILD